MTTDKRAAAIAAFAADGADSRQFIEFAREHLAKTYRRTLADAVCDLALAALEADDGRALLRLREWCSTVRADIGKRNIPEDRLYCAGARGALADTIAEINKLLAAPEQPEPEPAASVSIREGALQGAPTRGPVLTDRAEIDALKKRAFDASQPEPAAPHADDDGYRSLDHAMRILRGCVAPYSGEQAQAVAKALKQWQEKWKAAVDLIRPEPVTHADDEARIAEILRKHAKGWTENDRLLIDDALLLATDTIRCLAAGKAKAEAEVERLRGRDAEPFDWDAAPSVQEWIDENLPEREPRAGSKMVELHPDEVIADRGESRRVAGWLKDLMAENAKLRAERDAALAAQNARAGLLGRAVEAISECLPDEDLNDLSTHFHMECKRHHFERLKDVRDEMECALRAEKPEPAAEPAPERHHRANVCGIRRKSDGYWWQCDSEHGAGWNDKRIRQAWTMRAAHAHIADMRAKGMLREEVEVVELAPAEPVPAAADANRDTDDEVLRDMLCEALPVEMQDVVRCVRALCRRVLEVRP